jgi:hypothetical protein
VTVSIARNGAACLGGMLFLASSVGAQQYRLRLDSRFQSVSFRGVTLDSVPLSQTVATPGGGRESPDGFAVRCGLGDSFCFFFRPGSARSARPAVTSASATIWGFGVPGLRIRADARLALDLGNAEVWPGTDPSVQLLEGYAEYAMERVTGRLGRQVYSSRLGFTGFDGVRATGRLASGRVEMDGYLGWGLGRGTSIPVNSDALNPLDDFQPRQRQVVAGAGIGWNHRFGTARLEYQREVDPRSDYFVSERAALATTVRVLSRFTVDAGAEYDLATAQWGSADATLRYSRPRVGLSAGVQRYRPHFDLWTIWGAFSPVGFTGINGSASVSPMDGLSIRARGTRFWFEETGTETPLVEVEDRGWLVSIGTTYAISSSLAVSLDHSTEFGPGGSYASFEGAVTWLPRSFLTLSLQAGRLNRPLEFRYDEATLYHAGVHAEWRITDRWRATLTAARFMEERDRPDAGAFDWDQTRIAAGLVVLLGSDADRFSLPPAVRTPQDPTGL